MSNAAYRGGGISSKCFIRALVWKTRCCWISDEANEIVSGKVQSWNVIERCDVWWVPNCVYGHVVNVGNGVVWICLFMAFIGSVYFGVWDVFEKIYLFLFELGVFLSVRTRYVAAKRTVRWAGSSGVWEYDVEMCSVEGVEEEGRGNCEVWLQWYTTSRMLECDFESLMMIIDFYGIDRRRRNITWKCSFEASSTFQIVQQY